MNSQIPSFDAIRKAGIDLTELDKTEATLAKISLLMADYYKSIGGHDYPREWMVEHLKIRNDIINSRNHILRMLHDER